MTYRTPVALLSALVVTTALCACHGQSGAGRSTGNATDSGTTPMNVSIMVGGLDKVIYLPAQLTDQLGYFKDQGLTVKLEDQPSGANAETALVAGQVDAVVGFYDHTIDLQTKGKCVESVVQFADVPGEVEMVSTKAAGTITGAADFKSKKLGVTSPGSSTDFLTQYLAVKNHIAISQYTTVAAGAGASFIAALQKGGIDAGMTTDPTVEQVLGQGAGKVLLDMRTVAGTQAALGGLYPGSSLYMDCSYVSAHPKTVQLLVNAFSKTLAYIHSHAGAQIQAVMPSAYSQGNGGAAIYAKAIDASKAMFSADGVMDPAAAQNVLTVQSTSNPDVKGKSDTIDLTKTYTTQFAKAAS